MLGRGLLTSSRLAVCQQPARSFGRKASKMKVVLSKVRGCPRCSQLQYWSTPPLLHWSTLSRVLATPPLGH